MLCLSGLNYILVGCPCFKAAHDQVYNFLGTLAKNHNTKKDTLFKDCAPKRPNSILRHISLYSLNMGLPHKSKRTKPWRPQGILCLRRVCFKHCLYLLVVLLTKQITF